MEVEISQLVGGSSGGLEDSFLFNRRVKSAVTSAELEAARSRARALSSSKSTTVDPSGNSQPKVLAWDVPARNPVLTTELRKPQPEDFKDRVHRKTYHIDHEERRIPSPSPSTKLKGYHRPIITPRPSYRRSLNTANLELKSFREKFDAWKMTYDREIGKTKASLASMTPTLQGLGLAARIHKIVGRAAESLNPTPPRDGTPNATTPGIAMPSLQPLQLDADLLSNSDEFPDFLDDDIPIFSARADKLAEVTEDIDVLTTIIEKKIFATRVPKLACESVDEEDIPVNLCAWSEGGLTARTFPTIAPENCLTSFDDEELILASDTLSRTNAGVVADLQPGPANLRDNLIILARQKGFTDVPTPLSNGNCTGASTMPSERERALTLLRQIYAPSLAPLPNKEETKGSVNQIPGYSGGEEIHGYASITLPVEEKIAEDISDHRQSLQSDSNDFASDVPFGVNFAKVRSFEPEGKTTAELMETVNEGTRSNSAFPAAVILPEEKLSLVTNYVSSTLSEERAIEDSPAALRAESELFQCGVANVPTNLKEEFNKDIVAPIISYQNSTTGVSGALQTRKDQIGTKTDTYMIGSYRAEMTPEMYKIYLNLATDPGMKL